MAVKKTGTTSASQTTKTKRQSRKKEKTARLDPLNVFYGVGAAILLVGVMFKFLQMQYGDLMLFVGLATEAIVFLVSGFELQRVTKEYKWDKVFPQLSREEPTAMEEFSEVIEKIDLDPQIAAKLSSSIDKLEQNVSKMTEMSDTAQLTEHINRMKHASENFESEIAKLNQSIADMNKYYERMLDVMGQKKNDPTNTFK